MSTPLIRVSVGIRVSVHVLHLVNRQFYNNVAAFNGAGIFSSSRLTIQYRVLRSPIQLGLQWITYFFIIRVTAMLIDLIILSFVPVTFCAYLLAGIYQRSIC